MSYIDIGFDQFLTKQSVAPPIPEEMDPLDLDWAISQIDGSKIVNYNSQNFNFIPTSPNANPKEGDIYYDSQERKLKVYTGSSYETVTST